MGDLPEAGVHGVALHRLVGRDPVANRGCNLVGEVVPGEPVVFGIAMVDVSTTVLVGDTEDDILAAVPGRGVETLGAAGRHDWLGPPEVESLGRRLGLSVRPSIQEWTPAGPGRDHVEPEVGDAGVMVGVQAVGRGVPEPQVLREVKPGNQGAGGLQDDPEAGGDVDGVEVVSGVVARASILE